MPERKLRSSHTLDRLQAELNTVSAELADGHAMLDRFEVGKPHWSLAGRIELLGETAAQAKDMAAVLGSFIAAILEPHGITLEGISTKKYTAEQLIALLTHG